MNKSSLGTEKISVLMVRLSLPSILAYFINILYNIVDRIYIGHLGSAYALTGVGITLPILQLVSAFAAFAGAGGAPLAAIQLGKSESDSQAKDRAQKILLNSFLLLVVFSFILTVFFLVFKDPILLAFGASSQTLPYASQYLSIYLTGTLAVEFSIGLNPFITCQGHAKTAMFSVLIGAVLNLLLDPLFIFVLNMGVAGAAVATVISQAFSAAWILLFLCSRKSLLKLEFKKLKFDFKIVRKISSLGISPFIMQSTESAIFVVFNTGLQKYGGDAYVGAMTIMQSVMQMISVPVQGFNNGVQPLVSYNYGAHKFSRVKECVRKMLLVTSISMMTLTCLATVFPKTAAGIFTGDAEILTICKKLLPAYVAAMWIFWVQNTAQTVFVGLGNARVSVFIACLRKIILLIPLALVLPLFFGVEGIFYAEPVASITSAITSAVFLFFIIKKMDGNQIQSK